MKRIVFAFYLACVLAIGCGKREGAVELATAREPTPLPGIEPKMIHTPPPAENQKAGDVAVRVHKAIRIKGGVLVVIEVSVTNPDRRVVFKPWSQLVDAKDSKGNTCRPRGIDTKEEYVQVRAMVGDPYTPERIDSKRSAKLWFCFEEPHDNADSIAFELPAAAVEQTGTFKLTVPRSMWEANNVAPAPKLAAAEDKKEPAKLPKPWEEVVQVRRYVKGVKDKDGNVVNFINSLECYAFRKVVKDDTVFGINPGQPKGEANFIDVNSEITDEAGVVYVVTKYQEPFGEEPNRYHRCTVKKKDPQPKK